MKYDHKLTTDENAVNRIREVFNKNLLDHPVEVDTYGSYLINNNPEESAILYMAKVNAVIESLFE